LKVARGTGTPANANAVTQLATTNEAITINFNAPARNIKHHTNPKESEKEHGKYQQRKIRFLTLNSPLETAAEELSWRK
jgi:hypothetical protein